MKVDCRPWSLFKWPKKTYQVCNSSLLCTKIQTFQTNKLGTNKDFCGQRKKPNKQTHTNTSPSRALGKNLCGMWQGKKNLNPTGNFLFWRFWLWQEKLRKLPLRYLESGQSEDHPEGRVERKPGAMDVVRRLE